MHKHMPTERSPSPAARVGYHSGKRLATTIARRIAATFGRLIPPLAGRVLGSRLTIGEPSAYVMRLQGEQHRWNLALSDWGAWAPISRAG